MGNKGEKVKFLGIKRTRSPSPTGIPSGAFIYASKFPAKITLKLSAALQNNVTSLVATRRHLEKCKFCRNVICKLCQKRGGFW